MPIHAEAASLPFDPRPSSIGRSVSAPEAAAPSCAVCHGTEIVFDEVFDGGVLLLAECRRCEHRWTSRARPIARRPRQAQVRAGRRVGGAVEVAEPGVASAA